MSFLVAN